MDKNIDPILMGLKFCIRNSGMVINFALEMEFYFIDLFISSNTKGIHLQENMSSKVDLKAFNNML